MRRYLNAAVFARACAWAMVGVSVFMGCSEGKDLSTIAVDGESEAGTLELPLVTTAPSGTVYRLENAVFQVTNPFVSPPIDLSVPGDDDTLVIDLPQSVFDFDYTVFLLDGWQLIEVSPDGSERAVNATLVTFNPVSFTIRPRRTTPVSFQFRLGSDVPPGDGSVSIELAVDDSLIDDFEDGDELLPPIAGRNGAWFSFGDGTGTQTPAGGGPALPEVVDTSANFVLRLTGQDFDPAGRELPDGSFTFGAGLGTALAQDSATGQAAPYDVSSYAGLQFSFVISFPTAPGLDLDLRVETTATTPVENGGTCTEGCNDHYRIGGAVPFSPFFFTGGFTWDQFTQAGFGTPVELDLTTVLRISWQVSFPDFGQPDTVNDFDFQLSDMSFISSGSSSSGLVTFGAPTLVPPFVEVFGPTAVSDWQ